MNALLNVSTKFSSRVASREYRDCILLALLSYDLRNLLRHYVTR
jgi:hypothetical protein